MGKEKTQMTWKEIDGWFDFQDVYDMAISNADPTNRFEYFVEIGCYLGKSTAYMLEQIRKQKGYIEFVVIDNFIGVDGYKEHGLKERFLQNMCDCGFTGIDFCLAEKNSVDAINTLADYETNFAFIDGDHSYEGCLADIKAILPKMARNSILAGHDYLTSEGVKKAVNEVFGEKNITIMGNSWVVKNYDKWNKLS